MGSQAESDKEREHAAPQPSRSAAEESCLQERLASDWLPG